ncbi:putative oligopeptide ABC transporter integral membrane protein [Nostocoides japonicum T1-X7]|uniref:Putative oligopeptide ABC transporter integral membrane protein n=1 Tax=Nostocoides japonicum T1-X7 TaxID=1194083 RepID=A0A077LTM9_9MICO|nr:ABC transporter permease [Tetrasphaera japonica]CCH76968.1 putative oligopeptide ABC transporter integral membrane protein [Tetrasphaera japonica T1-X7]
MIRLVATRLATSVVTLFLAAFFVFFAVQALPGDVAQQLLGQNATPEAVATLRKQLGLDANVWQRFASWLGHAATGDFGTSLVSGQSVSSTIWTAFSHTLLIAVPAIIVGVTLPVLLGILAGARRGRATDSTISVVALVAMSIPEFVVATVLVLVFAIAIPVFPAVVLRGSAASFSELASAAVLPAVVLVVAMAAYIIRAMRSSTIDGLATEYATTAELKGVPRRRLLWRHVVPTAILPVLPVISINVAWLLGGVVVVESVFNYPGLGKLMIDSVSTRDLPVLQAIALLSALIYVLVNLAADLTALAADPRQRTLNRARRRRRRPTLEEVSG